MRFIGNKRNLIDDIELFVRKHVGEKAFDQGVFLDLFGGTNSVAHNFKKYMPIVTNDSMYFSYVLSRGATVLSTTPNFSALLEHLDALDVIDYLNDVPQSEMLEGFIALNYTLLGSDRNYMSEENGLRVDFIRTAIERWRSESLIDDDGYYYLLACLIEAVSNISNTKGSYAAFLAVPDKRSFEPLVLQHPILTNNSYENKAYHVHAETLDIKAAICYLDPPYGNQQYTSNYHLLETICLYDNPLIRGKTGIREYSEKDKSAFCSKVMAAQAMFKVVEAAQSPHIVLSYTSRGILDLELIKQALAHSCDPQSIVVNRFNYHTHKGAVVKRDDRHCEYLIYAYKPHLEHLMTATEMPSKAVKPRVSYSTIPSPNNALYAPIGYPNDHDSSYLDALKILPDDINEFVDVFAGDMTLSLNTECSRIISNGLNGVIAGMFEYLSTTDVSHVIDSVGEVIRRYNLSRVNGKGLLKLRTDYNKNPTPVKLYTLICHSYDYNFRFNSKGDYNQSHGRGRSSFSEKMKRNLMLFSMGVQDKDIGYHYESFDVLIDSLALSDKALYYCSPPSLLLPSSGPYSIRSLDKWSEDKQLLLYEKLDAIHASGRRFLLFEVLTHKDTASKASMAFSRKYQQTPVFNENKDVGQAFITNY